MTITHKLEVYDVTCGNCGYTYDEIEEREYLKGELIINKSTCPKCNTTAKLGLKK